MDKKLPSFSLYHLGVGRYVCEGILADSGHGAGIGWFLWHGHWPMTQTGSGSNQSDTFSQIPAPGNVPALSEQKAPPPSF